MTHHLRSERGAPRALSQPELRVEETWEAAGLSTADLARPALLDPTSKTSGMACPIEVLRRTPRSLDLSRYHYLHADGRALIQGWRDREVGQGPDASFESFIYLWIAFNSWSILRDRDGRGP